MMQPPSSALAWQQPVISWLIPKLWPISCAMVAATPTADSEWSCSREESKVQGHILKTMWTQSKQCKLVLTNCSKAKKQCWEYCTKWTWIMLFVQSNFSKQNKIFPITKRWHREVINVCLDTCLSPCSLHRIGSRSTWLWEVPVRWWCPGTTSPWRHKCHCWLVPAGQQLTGMQLVMVSVNHQINWEIYPTGQRAQKEIGGH